jgi:hypothetical protein
MADSLGARSFDLNQRSAVGDENPSSGRSGAKSYVRPSASRSDAALPLQARVEFWTLRSSQQPVGGRKLESGPLTWPFRIWRGGPAARVNTRA